MKEIRPYYDVSTKMLIKPESCAHTDRQCIFIFTPPPPQEKKKKTTTC